MAKIRIPVETNERVINPVTGDLALAIDYCEVEEGADIRAAVQAMKAQNPERYDVRVIPARTVAGDHSGIPRMANSKA